MQADHRKITAASRFQCLSAVVAICAAWPRLLLAAEPLKPDAPVQQQQPLEQLNRSEPKLTKSVYAEYPQLALRHGMECFVDLRFTVLPDGSTADIEVVHSEPVPLFALFEESATRAVKQFRYEPAIRNGEPVAQTVEVRIRFRR